MITTTLVTLALSLSLAQAEHAPAPPAGDPQPSIGTPGETRATDALDAPPQFEEAPAAGEKVDIGGAMLHHIADSYSIEFPGVCGGHFSLGCHLDLRDVFGTTYVTEVDPATGLTIQRNVSGPFVLGALDMTPTKHVVAMWAASLLLLLLVLGAVRRKSVVPRGVYNFVEVLVSFVRNEIAVKNIGEKDADRFVPYLLTAFFFILFLNLFGLFPYSATATANLSVTVVMALFTFVITQYAAIRAMGVGGFLAHLTGGVPKSLWFLWPIMIPVEILGLFTKPFALTVRLFANMAAGHFVILALLGLIFVISPWVAFGAVPMALAIFMLEVFVAFVQAYIFTMLSSLFIGAGLVHHGDEHHEGPDLGHSAHGHGHAGPGMGSEHGSHVAGATPGHG